MLLQGLFSSTRRQALVGLDMGASAVKLLQLSRRGGRYRVEAHAIQDLPEHAVVDKHIRNPDAVAAGLDVLARQTGTRGAAAAVAVADAGVITKTLELPAELSDLDLERQIIADAEQHIPFPLDEVAFDFARQQRSARHPDRVEVLLAACRKENVEGRVNVLRQGGFQARVVDIEAHAMARAFRLLREQMDLPEQRLVAIADIGATVLTLHVLLDGSAIHSREQPFDGRRLQSEELAPRGCAAGQAGAPASRAAVLDRTPALLQACRRDVAEGLGQALQFFFSSSSHGGVDLLVLSGGVAALPGLAEYVEASLGVRSRLAQPFARMSVGPRVDAGLLDRQASALMLACGLALRGV